MLRIRKGLLVLLLVSLLAIFSFGDALKFLPQNYSMLVYVPDLPKLYDSFKGLPIGQTLLLDTGIGLESLVNGILQQQLLSMKYTMSDFDLFMKEMLIATDSNGNISVVLGPVKNPTKVKNVLQSLLAEDTMKQVQFMENYFIFSNTKVGGGKAPAALQTNLKGNLGVTYTNISDGKIAFEGYGYLRVENNALTFYEKIDAKTNDAKTALKSLQNAKPIDILSDINVGGDVLVFVNRDIPDALQKATIGAILSALNITDVNASGKMYTSMDIGSAITDLMNTGTQSTTGSSSNKSTSANANTQQTIPSISSYSVVFGSGLKMPTEVKKYVTIGGERYGVLDTGNGITSYILIKSDRMITYTVDPSKYKAGDKAFFTSNYNSKYFAGILFNFEPLIYNLVGKKVKSSATFFGSVEGDSIIMRGSVK